MGKLFQSKFKVLFYLVEFYLLALSLSLSFFSAQISISCHRNFVSDNEMRLTSGQSENFSDCTKFIFPLKNFCKSKNLIFQKRQNKFRDGQNMMGFTESFDTHLHMLNVINWNYLWIKWPLLCFLISFWWLKTVASFFVIRS